MKRFLSIFCLLAILAVILNRCEQTSVNENQSEDFEVIKLQPSDVKHLPPPVNGCDPLVTNLIKDVETFTSGCPGGGTVVGTVTVTNDAENLYVHFELNQDAINDNCYLKKVMVWVHRQNSGKSFVYEQILVTHPTVFDLTIPKNICDVWKCDHVLDIVAKAIVCCTNEPLGGGGGISLTTCENIDLIAGQHYDAGQVTVEIDGDNLVVTYTTQGDWKLYDVHLAISTNDCDDIPTNGPGHPKIGNFPYSDDDLGGVTSYSFEIPLDDLNIDCDSENPFLCIAAHAVVKKPSGNGYQEETAWGICPVYGEKFTESGWAEHFNVYIDCDGGNFGGGEESCSSAWACGPRYTGRFLDPGQLIGWKLAPYNWCCL